MNFDKQHKIIDEEFSYHSNVWFRTYTTSINSIKNASNLIIEGMKSKPKKKLLLFGNGGSAADAQHIAAEFTNRYSIERIPLPAIALTTDSSAITAISNDYEFNEIFKKQIIAIGQEGDIAIGISTSGTSENVIRALDKAKELKIKTILLTGNHRTNIYPNYDEIIEAYSISTPRIQEMHILIGHIICRLVDEEFKKKNNINGTNNKKPIIDYPEYSTKNQRTLTL